MQVVVEVEEEEPEDELERKRRGRGELEASNGAYTRWPRKVEEYSASEAAEYAGTGRWGEEPRGEPGENVSSRSVDTVRRFSSSPTVFLAPTRLIKQRAQRDIPGTRS